MLKLFLIFLLFATSVANCSAGVSEEEKRLVNEMFLRGSAGPYRGRVIDAKSKQPIAGAIVVAVWYREVDALVQSATVFYDAIEVMSDKDGYFIVNAPNIEQRAPRDTQFPVFTIFKPGYTYFQAYFASLNDLFHRKDKSLLGVVELEPISHLSKREQFNRFPSRPLDVPREKIPMFENAWLSQQKMLREQR